MPSLKTSSQTENSKDISSLKLKETIDFQKELMSILNLNYLDEVYLKSDEKIIRFIRSDTWQQDVTIINIQEVLKDSYKISKINYSFDKDCNPVVGFKKLTKNCIKVNTSSEKTLSRPDYMKLLKLLEEEEIWDLKENESEVYEFDGILYHGDTWALEIRYCLNYHDIIIHPEGQDTTICRTQKLSRIFPERFKGIYKIGNEIMNLIK